LRIGDACVPLADSDASVAERIVAPVEAANRATRLQGLDDALNPEVIDSAKVVGFAAGLVGQPPALLARLAGQELWLGWEPLHLSTAAPTRAEAFAAPFALVMDEIQGRTVLAHTDVPIDVALAQSRVVAARAALAAIRAELRGLEAAGAAAPAGALGQARQRRAAVAGAWRLNARAWAVAAPRDPAARAACAGAERAARRYAMPSGGLAG
jgi:hypothetical protein